MHMNAWRWIGLFLFFAAVMCFVSARMPVTAGEKGDKDKQAKEKDKDKGADKDKDKDKEKDKDKDKEKDKDKDKKVKPSKNGSSVELKFTAFDKKGAEFYQKVSTDTKQIMKVMGQDVTQKQEQTFYIKWKALDKDKDGNFVVEQEVTGVKMKIDIGGNTIEFNSTNEKQPKNPMTDFFNALMKQKLTFTISPDLKILKIDGRAQFIKDLSETNPAIKTLLDTIMSEEALKQMAEPTWWAIPNAKKSKGDTWTRESTLKLGPIGTYTTNFTFTFDGPNANKLDVINIDAKLDYKAPEPNQTGLPFVIKSASLKSESGKGKALFDANKGRIDSSELTMKLEGTLTIEVGAMPTEIKLTQEQTSKTETSDTNPLKK
jgi:hypothetical protein